MYIISILEKNRLENISKVQMILSKYGDEVSARLGLHNLNKENEGLIIIIYTGKNIKRFIEELKQLENLSINYMKV